RGLARGPHQRPGRGGPPHQRGARLKASPRRLPAMRSCSEALLLGLLLAVLPVTSRAAAPAVDQDGDPLPPGAVARLGTSRLRHSSMVIGICFAPDGKSLASGGWDKIIRIWDPRTGRQLRQLEGHKQPVFCVLVSPDGKVLASAG